MSQPTRHKGILLAGGAGSRLHPLTIGVSKQLLPVHDKPMIYYPLSTLMRAGIRDILLISTPRDIDAYQRLLRDGGQVGLNIRYAQQPRPEGVPQALIIGREFVGDGHVALMLGDNIFYSPDLEKVLARAAAQESGATIFGREVQDPQRYGVVELDQQGQAVSLEEKPSRPKSNLAVTGLYFYDNQVLDIAESVKPSARGELEITDVNRQYLQFGRLRVECLAGGFQWLDIGTPESLTAASDFVHTLSRQGEKLGCIEEIAYRRGWIDAEQLHRIGAAMSSNYGEALVSIAQASE